MAEKIGRWIYKTFPKMEGASLLLIIAGVAAQKIGLAFYPLLLLMGLSALAVVYFSLAYLPPNKTGLWIIRYFHHTFPIACSVLILGVLFDLNGYAGGNLMLKVGTITLAISLACYAYFKWVKNIEFPFYDSLAWRGLLLLGVGVATHQGWLGI